MQAPQRNDDEKTEVAILRAQLATMRENDKRILETVRYSATSLVVMASLLATYGWFVHQRNFEREIAIFEKDAKSVIERELLTATRGWESNSIEKDRTLNNMLTARNQYFDSALSLQQKTFDQKLSEQSLKLSQQNTDNLKRSMTLLETLEKMEARQNALGAKADAMHSKTLGLTFFEQGVRLSVNKIPIGATESFLIAGKNFIGGSDELNMRKCVKLLLEGCFPALTREDLEAPNQIAESFPVFTKALEGSNANGRYQEEIAQLKAAYAEVAKRSKPTIKK